MRKLSYIIISVLIFSLLSLCLYFQVPPNKDHLDVDSKAYVQLGLNFSQEGYFSNLHDMPYYTLGYPVFVGLIYRVLGPDNYNIVIIQLLISIIIGFLIFNLANNIFGEPVGLISLMFFSINIGYLTFTQFVLSEVVLSLFLLLFFRNFIYYYKYEAWHYLFWSALSLGISVIIKPAGLFFSVVVLAVLLFISLQKSKSFFKIATLFICTFCMSLVLHMYHNKVMWDKFQLCNLASVNLHYWFLPNLLAHLHDTNSNIERNDLIKISNKQKVSEILYQTVYKHPFLAVKVWGLNMLKTLSGLFTSNLKVLVDPVTGGGCVSFFMTKGSFLQRGYAYITMGTNLSWVHIVGFLEAFFLMIRYFLVFLGLGYLGLRKEYFILFFTILFIGYFVGVTGHDGCARFRMMVEFVFIMLSSLACYHLFYKKICEVNE